MIIVLATFQKEKNERKRNKEKIEIYIWVI